MVDLGRLDGSPSLLTVSGGFPHDSIRPGHCTESRNPLYGIMQVLDRIMQALEASDPRIMGQNPPVGESNGGIGPMIPLRDSVTWCMIPFSANV